MLFRLWHPTVIRRYNKKREIDRADAGDHVADKIFVTGNVDHTDGETGQFEMREPKFNRNPARFLFRQPICVGASERTNERGLAVIDMSGSGEDEVPYAGVVRHFRRARITISSCSGKMVRRSSRYFRRTM